MIIFDNGGWLLELTDQLPELAGEELFLDLETTSFDEDKKALNPWHDCWVLGVAIKSDNGPAYYVPVNHADGMCNRPQEEVRDWLLRVIARHQVWVNHNVKFDAQVLFTALGVDTKIKKYCTVDLAKLIDSDRFQHSLDALARDWLHENINGYEQAMAPYLVKNLDYGLIPTEICGEYACQDVLTNHRLWRYIDHRMPSESRGVMEMSSRCVDTLIKIERNGMRVNPQQVQLEELKALNRMTQILSQIAERIGFTILPTSPADCRDYLCNHLGLPVLAWNDPKKDGDSNPKFDKAVLEAYKTIPGADVQVLEWMLEYRRLSMFTSMFCSTYNELQVEGLLHPSYKQTVRTGRMACAQPNMQQLMAEAKKLIIPADGNVIISADYSQIEFRVIVHYIKAWEAIRAYAADPFTDFHMWVKNMCDVERDTAKTLNFMMGYGGGKKKLVKALSQQESLIAPITEYILSLGLDETESRAMFMKMALDRGVEVYEQYHGTLPTLKPTSAQAERRVHQRGYCVNKYGRRRTLPIQAAWRAFNTVCQGTAADMMKERLVALDDYLASVAPDLKLIGVVHDEVVLEGPAHYAQNEHLLDSICYVLEDISVELLVPIRTSLGYSTTNWYDASKSDSVRRFDRTNFEVWQCSHSSSLASVN
jgi:DNA polymerase-1